MYIKKREVKFIAPKKKKATGLVIKAISSILPFFRKLSKAKKLVIRCEKDQNEYRKTKNSTMPFKGLDNVKNAQVNPSIITIAWVRNSLLCAI
jgi:hypothetical protein